jgi:hypothetical protein
MQHMVAEMVKSAVAQVVPPALPTTAPQPSEPHAGWNPAPPPAVEPLPPARPAPEVQQLRDPGQPVEAPRRGTLAPGFETLDMPFVDGPTAKKTQRTVIFDMGQEMGSISAKYHAVVEGAGCISLVYDTRYDEGMQWSPPNRGTSTIGLACPELQKEWTVSSMGIQFSVGVLDIIVLIRQDEVDANAPPRMMET